MWSLPSLTNLLPDFGNPPEAFEQDYTCYPVSFLGREELECGNKVLLPQSALSQLARMNVSWPMLFQMQNEAFERQTHGGVLEFSAGEGTCYMPYWMMKNLLLKEGDVVKIKNTCLPKGTYVKLQPVDKEFLEISDHRAVLEYTLRHFAAMTVGDSIVISHNGQFHEIEIVNCLPADAISIIETDVQVDFAPPKNQPITETSSTPVNRSARKVKTVQASSPKSENPLPIKSVKIPGGVRTYHEGFDQVNKAKNNQFESSRSQSIPGSNGKEDSSSFTLFGGSGNKLS